MHSAKAQETPVVMQRTPEQEAAKQTEKLQQELSLTQEQVRKVYEINLRYARARQVSNTRTEAMERMKNKNADLEKVLTADQNERLQSKRYERSNFDPNSARMSTQSASQQVVGSRPITDSRLCVCHPEVNTKAPTDRGLHLYRPHLHRRHTGHKVRLRPQEDMNHLHRSHLAVVILLHRLFGASHKLHPHIAHNQLLPVVHPKVQEELEVVTPEVVDNLYGKSFF